MKSRDGDGDAQDRARAAAPTADQAVMTVEEDESAPDFLLEAETLIGRIAADLRESSLAPEAIEAVEECLRHSYRDGRKTAERSQAATIRDAKAEGMRDRQALADALHDMLAGWRYIRQHHGDLAGVGWDRAQQAAETALAGHAGPSVSRFLYTNYRGEISERHVIVRGVRWGSTEWHPKPQLLMRAWDIGRGAEREFAVKDMRPLGDTPDAAAP